MTTADGHHTLHYRVEGGADGIPVFVFHGGWGPRDADGECVGPDPARHRLVRMHQRGWGKSTPLGSTKENSPKHTLADVELLREKLGISRWIVVKADIQAEC